MPLRVLLIMAVSLHLFATEAYGTDFAVERFKRVPFVMAHRSCWSPEVPENSLKGIDLCLKNGVDMLEVDTQHTRDGVLVVIHDETLDRTTNLTGRVALSSYNELSRARLRYGLGGPDAKLSAEPLPTLAQALRRIRGKAILFIDIKNPEDRPAVLDLVSRKHAEQYVAMYAFAQDDLEAYRRLPDWAQRHMIVSVVENGAIDGATVRPWPDLSAASHEFSEFHPLAFMVIPKDLHFVGSKVSGDPIALLTAPIYGLAGARDEGLGPKVDKDPDYLWGDLLKAGATGFMTNHPLELVEYASHHPGDRR